jgi:polyisoprenoid-binding protein YceI
MKTKSLILGVVVAAAAFAFNFANIVYKVDVKSSKVTWVGRKITGEHTGAINIADGQLTSDGKKVTGGTFNIDMNSITCTDLTDAEWNGKLVGHLKSEDFFNTAKFAKSTLVIKSLTSKGGNEYIVKGELTIKGIKNPIEFPANIVVAADKITAKATIIVDRTLYDIKYGSASFFDSLGDKAIDNAFELKIDLVAKK